MLHLVHTRGARSRAALVDSFGHVPVRIGSDAGNDVALDDPESRSVVMPRHAEVRFEQGALCLIDLGTPTGTFVNGARIGTHRLRHGDVVTLGGARGPEMRVELTGPLATSLTSEDGKVDLATAERIVKAAVVRAASSGTSTSDRANEIIRQQVLEARRRTSRYNMLLGVGIALALCAALFAAWTVYFRRSAADVLAAEAGIGRAPVPKAAGEIPARVLTGRAIYEQNRETLYVLGYTLGNRVGGCCSAFAVGPSVLATNAHCVRACGVRGGTPIVTQNDSGGKARFKILRMTMHPAYKEGKSADSPDVGLVRVDGRLPKAVTLASDAELRALGPGDDAYVLGFPGRVMDPISPSATFLQGRIGRVMSLAEEATTPDKAVLIQHDAVTRGGNSGSPIFNQYGHVIGVHAAHIDEENDVDIGGKRTTVLGSSPFRLGMRIDLLKGVPAP